VEEVVLNVGDEFTVDFVPNRNGGKPVCRIEGVVAFIDKKCRGFVAPESSWIVRIVSIFDRFITVEPLVLVRTPYDNKILMDAKLMAVVANQHEPKHQKVAKVFLYRTAQEIRQLKKEAI